MMKSEKHFIFKDIDPEGFETLRVISDAVNFNNWTFESVQPFCSGRILEIGSGIGNISSRFIEAGYDITLSDIRANYRTHLLSAYGNTTTHKRLVLDLDLVHPEFDIRYHNLMASFDTVFALNVVEHIENDSLAIANCNKLLKPGGTLIILVPAFQSLYNNFDKELYHFRRYRKKTLSDLFRKNGFNVAHSFYFNAGGIPGWFVSGYLQKHKTIPAGQMKIFDSLVPVFKIIDRLLFRKVGLSVICTGKKL